jgi:hypothetical protein
MKNEIETMCSESKVPRKLHTVWNCEYEEHLLKMKNDKENDFLKHMIKRYPNKKLVGFWRNLPFEDSKFPWPGHLIDETQHENLINTIVDYLDDPKFYDIDNGYLGSSKCRICGEQLGSVDCIDDKWVWPEKLSHYMKAHKVKLPDEFVEHILTERGIPLYEVK